MSIVSRLGQLLLAGAVALAAWNGCAAYAAGALPADPHDVLASVLAWTDRSVADVLIHAPRALQLAAGGALLWLIGRRLRKHRTGAAAAPAADSVTQAAAPQPAPAGSEMRAAFRACRSAFAGAAAFSLVINILMLTGSMFMLEVYDRVLPSRSVPTLIAMCGIAAVLFLGMGLLDMLRNRLLARAAARIDESLAARVLDVVVRLPVRTGSRSDGLLPLRDLDTIRAFLSGQGPTALLDLPWLPFYLGIIYLLHPLLGLTALGGAVILVSLTLVTEFLSRRPAREATRHMGQRLGLAQACHRNAEVLTGMGFASRLGSAWAESNDRALAAQQHAGDITGGLGAIARVLRMMLQSAVLATGAYLVIMQEASGGIIIAGSILSARALAPIDVAIANWRGFVGARQSWARLRELLAMLPGLPRPMPLPAPTTGFRAEGLVVVPPGEQRVAVRDVSFALKPSQGLGIIGPSGSGKSSLARVLVGAWLPAAGRVRLDGASLEQWAPEALGRHIGYLPQGVELFAGSIAQNIARFDPEASSAAVIAAARAADVHELIVSLPNGYDTDIGDGGATLSAGQRQRVGLARALYGDPFLLVLDEPDASLDQDGEQALHKAIVGVRARGGIAIVVSHRRAVLGAVDLLLALEKGKPVAAGPKQLVLQKLTRPVARVGSHAGSHVGAPASAEKQTA